MLRSEKTVPKMSLASLSAAVEEDGAGTTDRRADAVGAGAATVEEGSGGCVSEDGPEVVVAVVVLEVVLGGGGSQLLE